MAIEPPTATPEDEPAPPMLTLINLAAASAFTTTAPV